MRWHAPAAGAAAGVLVHLAGGQAWESVGAAVVAGTAQTRCWVREALAARSALEAPLPEFLRQMAGCATSARARSGRWAR